MHSIKITQLAFVFVILFLGCSDTLEENCLTPDCNSLVPFGLGLAGQDQGVIIDLNVFVDAGFSCSADQVELFISEDNMSYAEVPLDNVVLNRIFVDSLENGKEYFFELQNHHCKLPSLASKRVAIKAGIPDVITEVVNIGVTNLNSNFDLSYDNRFLRYGGFTSNFEYQREDGTLGSHTLNLFVEFARWIPGENEIIFQGQNFSNNQTQIYHINVDNGITTLLLSFNSNNVTITHLDLASDGSKLYFVRSSEFSFNDRSLWELDLQTEELKELSSELRTGGFFNSGFQINPLNENEIYYSDIIWDGIENLNTLFLYNITTQTKEEVHNSIWDERFLRMSPSGNKMAYFSKKTGRSEIWILDLQTKETRQVSTQKKFEFSQFSTYLNWLNEEEFVGQLEDGFYRFELN